jgi:putative oxidoreductase
MTFFRKLLRTDAPAAIILIRLIVGGVFLSEGIQKFVYPEALGVGRFTKIGIPVPEVMAPFVGVCETACGVLFLLGLLTRFAAVTMIIDMIVAILSTKVPILLGQGFWLFGLPKLGRYGFWSMAHEARTDWSMLLGSIFLLVVGAGKWSVDARLVRKDQQ